MLLHQLIFESARKHPDRAAVVRNDHVLTYDELASSLGSVATGLVSLGLRAGDRVGVYLNKRVEAVQTYFAVSLAGCVFVPINPLLKPAQVAHILHDCDVRVLVTTDALARGLANGDSISTGLSAIVTIDDAEPEPLAGHATPLVAWQALQHNGSGNGISRIDHDVAAILYTSGSTGKPKGVVLSHRNMVTGAMSVAGYLENTPDDVILAVLPFSFDAGFSQMSTAFAVGASVVLMDYLLPGDVISAVQRFRATGLAGVPSLWNQLARLEWPREAQSTLRYLTNTGGAMPAETLALLRSKLPETQPFLMYGLTEAFRSTYLPPDELDSRPGSIGKAIPGAEIMVVREDGTPCAAGEPGELVHRGALVALGYWNDPARTAERFKPVPGLPGELPVPELAVWSGDTVKTDDDGFLYFVGRRDEMIKSSGYRISPTEVEEIAHSTGMVSECAAIGVPDAQLGQAVILVCKSDQPARAESVVMETCARELPAYMRPSRLVFRDDLPRNVNGKIDRKLLTEEYRQPMTSDVSNG